MSGNRFRPYLVCMMLIVVAVLIGCSTESKTLKVTPSKLDFGSVYIGDASPIDIILKNKYGKPIIISTLSITGSTDFSMIAGNALPINLDKNAEHTLSVQFAPTVGTPVEALLSIIHDASTKSKEITLEGIGVAVPRIEVPVDTHDFGIRLNNMATDHTFEIKNVGSADMNIGNYSFTGTGASAYTITSGGTIPTVIPFGSIHTITVEFESPADGTYPADLEISHDAVNQTPPFVISLTGEGVSTAPKIDVNRTGPWDFGSVAKTMPAILDLEISSIGSDPLTVTSITFTTGTEFSLDSVEDANGNVVNLPQAIAVSSKITAKIKFAPSANQTYNDTMTIMHDGLYNPAPLDIAVSGTGRDEMQKTFTYTGSAQQWTVPAGVSLLYVECYGAQGGRCQWSGWKDGGKGGMAAAKVPVTPGDTINVYVGGKGISIMSSMTGGWNGGGGTNNGCGNDYSGQGGGGSDIRVGGTALTDRVVVGGGGGGAGLSGQGGDGGGLSGGAGVGNQSGGVGTQTSGGASGGSSATAGTFGQGGRGKGNSCGGGGGGGGWYGGGGGYNFGAGGGGSSYYDAAGNTDKSTQTGVKTNDGEIIVKY